MKYRIALASFDGQYVDQHFGHARKYYIYEIDSENNTFELVDKRFLETACECSTAGEKAFSNVFKALNDVAAIIVNRIGPGAAMIVENKGYVLYQSSYPIENILNGIIKSRLYEEDKWQSVMKN